MRFAASHSLLALTTLALVAPAPVSACPVMVTALHPVTAKGTTMLPGGGLLLGLSNSFGNTKNAPGDFTLVDDTGATIDTTLDTLAPGLVRLTPKAHADRELTLAEGGNTLFDLHDVATTSALAAPKLAKVTSTHARGMKAPPPYPLAETTTIELAAAPSADILGIILYGADKNPRAWLRAKGTTYQLAFGGKGCGGVGESGTIIGENVMLAFVDSGGRVSARTKLVRVTATPKPAPTK